MGTSWKRLIYVLTVVLLLPLLLLILPRARTAVRLVPGFEQLGSDPRIRYEPGAEEFAVLLAQALPEAIRWVETVQLLPFKPGFRVYVTSSHERFMARIGENPRLPVRGIAFPWDIWISPRTFDFYGSDTHRQTLAHELSHLHIKQHAGRFGGRRNLPTWFCEGLANLAADMGFDRASREEAVDGLVAGRHFHLDTEGSFLLPDVGQIGVSWPMLHSQSRLFLDYLHQTDPDAFGRHLLALFDGRGFARSFEEQYGRSLEVVWSDFVARLAAAGDEPLPAGEAIRSPNQDSAVSPKASDTR